MEFHWIKLALLYDSQVPPESRSSPKQLTQLCLLCSGCVLQITLPPFQVQSLTQTNNDMAVSIMNIICQTTSCWLYLYGQSSLGLQFELELWRLNCCCWIILVYKANSAIMLCSYKIMSHVWNCCVCIFIVASQQCS